MEPEQFRKRYNIAKNKVSQLAVTSSCLTLLSATSALGVPFETSNIIQTAPLAIIFGTLGFGLVASILVRNARQNAKNHKNKSEQQIADLRTNLDRYENLLASLPEILIVWPVANIKPKIYGQSNIIFDMDAPLQNITKYNSWLSLEDSNFLLSHIEALRNKAMGFEVDLTSLNGKNLRISGHIMAGSAAIRIRAISQGSNITSLSQLDVAQFADFASTKSILALLSKPAWICNLDGKLVYSNAAYLKYSALLNKQNNNDGLAEIISKELLHEQVEQLRNSECIKKQINLANGERSEMTIFNIEGGSAGFLKISQNNQTDIKNTDNDNGFAYVDAFSLPVAVFDKDQKLCHFNKAYCELWGLDKKWLNSGVNETAILNKLHTKSLLPSVVNYRKWRKDHLASYELETSRINEWYLPDGRILSVKAVPASGQKGVVYIFEDISESRALKISHNALVNVQSETLNSLSEGVAVFGTNARLTLSNPSLSMLWGIPLNELDKNLHIDEIGELCAKAMPQDGKQIWQDLKAAIIDLSPSRSDKAERIKISDGRVIDYKITRLPDGQSMMSFVDVTKSISFETMLKERNEALIIADKIKDDFVKNVSYELRSPLTNIIGFSDMLDSGVSGELNKKQQEYTSYIKNSSQRLGILIDNILDLATIDAGVAELNFEQVDIMQLVERAKAGLVSMNDFAGTKAEINLIVEIEPNLPPLIADSTRIVQILYNLLANAMRFSEAGSRVWLNISSNNTRIIFTIEDEGEGISEEMKAVLFKRFEREATQGQQTGAGLGLAIVKSFVNLHSGSISLEKREPKGTRIIVSLPTNAEQAGSVEQASISA